MFNDRKAIYDIWAKMIDRCFNKNNISYQYYGAKGIKVCPEWLSSFECFKKDMGDRPSKNHTLDRVNNSLNYMPSNCKWSTIIQQNNNKSDTRIITFNEKTMNMSAWAKEIGTSPAALHHRIVKMNMSIDMALTIPFIRTNRKQNMLLNKEIK